MIEFDFSKLKGKIVEKYSSQSAFSMALGVSKVAFSRKMNNNLRFSVNEIYTMVNLLDLSIGEIGDYFFTIKV